MPFYQFFDLYGVFFLFDASLLLFSHKFQIMYLSEILKKLNINLEDVYYGFTRNIQGKNITIPPGVEEYSVIKIPGTSIILKIKISKQSLLVISTMI